MNGNLVKRLKSGDSAALRELYTATFAALYRFVYFRTQGNHQATQDIVHDTFLEAVRSLSNYRARNGSLQAWLCGIARNRLRTVQRSQRTEMKALHALAKTTPDNAKPPDPEPLDMKMSINAALAALPERYSDVLVRKYVHCQSVREIADSTGQTEKAVESLLSRARAAFRESFAADGESHD